MKVLQLNYSDINGGAARAAHRIHQAVRDAGIDSKMIVSVAASGDWTVQGPQGQWARAMVRLKPRLASLLRAMLRTSNPIIHSPAVMPSGWAKRLNTSTADLVHLHWVQEEMLSISDIGRIRKPVLWTLHDMWAFCGAEHYTEDQRWLEGYHRNNRPPHERGLDLNRFTWQRKRRQWERQFHIVCPSTWLADCARQSALMGNWPITMIPYPIDLRTWAPLNQHQARDLLHLPQDRPLVLFGAMGGTADPRKGAEQLFGALQILSTQLRDTPLEHLELVVFGQLAPRQPPNLGFQIHYTGHLHDDLSLRALYSAADLLVVPSRQDNLPNTGLEAHACGTPIVAFRTGGLVDIVDDRRTGALADPFDTASLAAAIGWVLEDTARRRGLGAAARARAEQLWNPERIAAIYSDLYCEVLASQTPQV